MRITLCLFLGMLLVPLAALAADTPRVGLYATSFDETTPLADIGEILRRTLPVPVYDGYLFKHDLPTGQVITPASEQWQVYVPGDYNGSKPYGVLVWIEPGDALEFPAGWKGALDHFHLIYVAAAKSGNDQDVRKRRIPLALTGLANIEAQYKIDPVRVYIGGFSGGGRVASLVAAAYADVFTGGIFVANSYGLGSPALPVPSLRRLKLMRSRGRYVFLVGMQDSVGALITSRAVAADQQLCVLNLKTVQMWNMGHAEASGNYLRYALNYLASASAASGTQQTRCEQRLQMRLDSQLGTARSALAQDNKSEARRQLLDLYQVFGPLAEPRFDQLWNCLSGDASQKACPRQGSSPS